MLLIYCNNQSSRLSYILNFIFRDILQLEYTITKNKAEFLKSNSYKINYSNNSFSDEAVIYNAGLLDEIGINEKHKKSLIPDSWEGNTIFFRGEGDFLLNFDIFSASFYLISRYEEYLSNNYDIHGRFPAENSMAYKYGFLKKPLVDRWAYILLEKLTYKYPGLRSIVPQKRSFNFIPTIDVDNAWAFKNKNIGRTLGGLIKSNKSAFSSLHRIKVLLNLDKDPYDNFEYIRKLHLENNLKAKYFILLGNYGKYDKNVHYLNSNYRSLIKNINLYADTGIHPSYQSNTKDPLLKKEIRRLEIIIGEKIRMSRQHFLKFNLPQTYNDLEKNDIHEDYSMAYSDHTGFRAGTCTPFIFYNLIEERETKLKIFPFQVMDVCLKEYLNFSPEEAISEISKLIDNVKEVNGTFISLWHNESLSESVNWMGWRRVYEYLIKTASSNP